MLFNQAHDLMSGVMTDHVYDDTIRGYDFSQAHRRRRGPGQRWQDFAARIDTQGEGIPVAVFNMLGWPRTDIAVANVGFSDSNVTDREPGRSRRPGGAGPTAHAVRVTPAAACCGPKSPSWPATSRRWDTPSIALLPRCGSPAAAAAANAARTSRCWRTSTTASNSTRPAAR